MGQTQQSGPTPLRSPPLAAPAYAPAAPGHAGGAAAGTVAATATGKPTGDWPPPRLRVYASRTRLRVGLAAGVAAAVGPLAAPHLLSALGPELGALAPAPGLRWIGVLAGLFLVVRCAYQWVARLPVIEFSELGVCAWLHGPYHRPFFVPWKRVKAAHRGSTLPGTDAGTVIRAHDALCLQIEEDDGLRIPPIAAGTRMPVRGAGPSELAWPERLLDERIDALIESIAAIRASGERHAHHD
jgi:hypothetical protein